MSARGILSPELARRLLIATLLLIPLLTASYKVFVLDYRLADILPDTHYRVTVEMSLDGDSREVNSRTFLPENDSRQTILTIQSESIPSFRFSEKDVDGNRVGTWFGSAVPDDTRFQFSYMAQIQGVRYILDEGVALPEEYPGSLGEYLSPEEAVQVDDPEIAATLTRIGADVGSVTDRLRLVYAFVESLGSRPFSGTTDALTALRLNEASCNGRSRLATALLRASGIPTRLVGGLVLETGRKRTSHQWYESYVGGNWVPFDPTNHHYAELPPNYIVLYRGDHSLFRHTSDINFDYTFDIQPIQVPAARTLESFRVFNVWAMFDRLELPFSLLRTVLMLPIGALLVVVFRNVIGVPTFGTFLPALIAAAAGETGLLWGLVSIVIVLLTVAVARLALTKLRLLHSPTLAILLAVVVFTMLATAMVAERLDIMKLTRITYFPIAVMAIAAERFYLALAEQGPKKAFNTLGGSLLVVLCCYLVMNSIAVQVLVSGFTELLLWVIAANIYLGRWVGVRVLEVLRFRPVIVPDGGSNAPV